MSWLEAKTSLHQQGRKVDSCQMLKKTTKEKGLLVWFSLETSLKQLVNNSNPTLTFPFPKKKQKNLVWEQIGSCFFSSFTKKKGSKKQIFCFFVTKTLWGLEQEQDFKPSETELFIVSLSFFTFSLFGNKKKLFPFSPFGNKKNYFLFCLGQVAKATKKQALLCQKLLWEFVNFLNYFKT